MTSDGYFRTGDIGVRAPDGYIRIVDRKKDMILVSGFNVYPNEIEAAVATLAGVREAAAVRCRPVERGRAMALDGEGQSVAGAGPARLRAVPAVSAGAGRQRAREAQGEGRRSEGAVRPTGGEPGQNALLGIRGTWGSRGTPVMNMQSQAERFIPRTRTPKGLPVGNLGGPCDVDHADSAVGGVTDSEPPALIGVMGVDCRSRRFSRSEGCP
jgi:hypothetical protein